MALFNFLKRKDKSQKSPPTPPSESSTPPPLRKTSKSVLRKPSFSHSTNVSANAPQINSAQDLPEVLLPIVTLISHQQARQYYKGEAYYSDNLSNGWSPVSLDLSGNDISVQSQNSSPTVINICDCDLNYNKQDIVLSATITNSSIVNFQFNSLDDLNVFYTAVLLCKFEYQQLQEAYTGALLSSQAINFSDIKTLLSPSNKNIKEEWCVIRFPFLNDKWIRCLLVVKPNDKIEIYTHSSKSKKHLLSTVKNGQSCYTIYPNDPSQIQNNSLLRLFANCYINEDLLNVILNDDTITGSDSTSIRSKKSRRSNSLSKRLSINSLKSVSSTSSTTNNSSSFSRTHNHQRVSSIDTTVSDSSFNNTKTPKKLSKKSIIKSHLLYIIPESHASVKPCEITLRLLIPILNSFSLYGRPQKFISSRSDKNSLLFGLPQLPNTYYINNKSALDLVSLNIDNSIIESWTSNDWSSIFKELLSTLMEKGWTGGSYQGDLANINLSLLHVNRRSQEFVEYDPMEDFIDRASSANTRSRSMSNSVSAVNEVY